MKVSAGIVIIYNKKMLLLHPTNSGKRKMWSFPKGGVEENETLKEAAIRETAEECDIHINPEKINDDADGVIEYRDKNNRKYKEVYYFLFYTKNLEELGLENNMYIPKEKLQIEEVNRGWFIEKNMIDDFIFWRFAHLKKYI